MNKYQYTMLLSPVNESELLTFMEGTNAKLIMKLSIIVQSDLSEEDKVKEDRKSVVQGKSVDLGGRRIIKKKKKKKQ